MTIIEIVISPDGQSRVETRGFAGNPCREASRFLETALGEATSERLTSEFYEAQSQQENHLKQEPSI